MSAQDLKKGLEALGDDDVRAKVADGDVAAAGELELTEEEQGLLVGAASDEPEVVGHLMGAGLLGLTTAPQLSTGRNVANDVTVNKAKTADKQHAAMMNVIKG